MSLLTLQEESDKEFDESFKCIQGDCDGTGHIPEQISEDEWTSQQCQFHAEYLLKFKSFLHHKLEKAYNLGQLKGVEMVEEKVGSEVLIKETSEDELVGSLPDCKRTVHFLNKRYEENASFNTCRKEVLEAITKIKQELK